MEYKSTITKKNGSVSTNTIPGPNGLRLVKQWSRKNSKVGDRICIEEIHGYNSDGYSEINTLYDYVVENFTT